MLLPQTRQQLEIERDSAAARANRAMREATLHLHDQVLWGIWQDAEIRALVALRRWQEAQAKREEGSMS